MLNLSPHSPTTSEFSSMYQIQLLIVAQVVHTSWAIFLIINKFKESVCKNPISFKMQTFTLSFVITKKIRFHSPLCAHDLVLYNDLKRGVSADVAV